ncbi:MAG: hypothetical protein Q9M30_03930 [Mariprofundaceae bacterium]|nr:hypothetical protein [Mariprofundaceae bacterium]
MNELLTYLKDALKECIRLAMAGVWAAVANLGLLHLAAYAWVLYSHTPTGEQFASLHPGRVQMVTEVVALTPYWQTAVSLAVGSLLFALALIALMQVSGLLRLAYDSLPAMLRLLWPVPLALIFATFYDGLEGRLDAYQAYVFVLLPGMFCVFWPVMKAIRRLAPDLTMLASTSKSAR